MTRPPFPKESKRETEIDDIIHSDVCGSMRVLSNGKAWYLVTFIDDSSRWCEVRFLQNKNDVLKEFENYRALMERQHGVKIKCLQSDNGGEFVSTRFDEALKRLGIQRRLTAAHNPEQNGVAERKNRSLIETARCLLAESGLPLSFWAEAVHYANYIRNRCPTRKLEGRTPFEARHGKAPDVTGFKKFGEEVYCLDRSRKTDKFEPRSRKGVFLGYSEECKAHRVWIPEDRRVQVTRDIKFLKDSRSNLETPNHEEITAEKSNIPGGTDSDYNYIDVELIQSSEHNNDDREDLEPLMNDSEEESHGLESDDRAHEPRRGRGRPRRIMTGRPGRPRKIYSITPQPEEATHYAFLTETPIKQAMASPESSEWIRAMSVEVKSILKNDTWDIVDRPENCEAIGSRFVLRNKYAQDGKLEKRKARIVARGFSQRPGVDFHETYAPVACLKSIRLAIALAAHRGMYIHQFDITTAYLNGTLEEKVYMETPDYMEEVLKYITREERKNQEIAEKAKKMLDDLLDGDKVCLMRKALYGLRQVGRVWHERLDREIRKFGAKPSNADPCIYLKNGGDLLIIIIVYVDDILIVSPDMESIVDFREHLRRSFDVSDLGELKYCLGLDFERLNDGIHMSQATYINDILR